MRHILATAEIILQDGQGSGSREEELEALSLRPGLGGLYLTIGLKILVSHVGISGSVAS